MANEKHLDILNHGVEEWNRWRKINPDIIPDLSEADLSRSDIKNINLIDSRLREADLSEADLGGADLSMADLRGTNLYGAILNKARLVRANLYKTDLLRWGDSIAVNLREAELKGANLYEAILSGACLANACLDEADLRKANLQGADLGWARLNNADLRGALLDDAELSYACLDQAKLCRASLGGAKLISAKLKGADLSHSNLRMVNLSGANLYNAILDSADLMASVLFETNLTKSSLNGCRIYGISAWNLKLDGAIQKDFIITQPFEPEITVDYLEVAQFIYLIQRDRKVRDIINTMRTKTVLILGSFSKDEPEDKDLSRISRIHTSPSVEILKTELRSKGFIPMVFNFKPPEWQHMIETVKTLALLSHFVLIDMSDPAGQYIEYGNFDKIYAPIITIASEGIHITKMALSPSEYWVVDEPIRYRLESAQSDLAALLNDSILPLVNEINKRLVDDRRVFQQ